MPQHVAKTFRNNALVLIAAMTAVAAHAQTFTILARQPQGVSRKP
jgi:hypothetical protein